MAGILITDIFNSNPFKAIELTNFINRIDPVPTLLGDFGDRLFQTNRVRTRTIAVHQERGIWKLVPTSSLGSPPVELEPTGKDMKSFSTRRLAKASTLYAETLQGLLSEPEFVAFTGVQDEMAKRSAKIRDDIEKTHEHMRLGAVQGLVVDADGVTVLDNWYTNWGVTKPPPFNFHFDQATAGIRATCRAVIDAMWTASAGSWVDGQTEVHALCGASFFVKLVTHPMVERLYLNYAAAQDLAGNIADDFTFGGITFHRYRGTTTTTDFTVGDDTAAFFPVGADQVFQKFLSPAEFIPFINTEGQDAYVLTIPDRDRQAWVRAEVYNYPLIMCMRPEMLQSAVSQ